MGADQSFQPKDRAGAGTEQMEQGLLLQQPEGASLLDLGLSCPGSHVWPIPGCDPQQPEIL